MAQINRWTSVENRFHLIYSCICRMRRMTSMGISYHKRNHLKNWLIYHNCSMTIQRRILQLRIMWLNMIFYLLNLRRCCLGKSIESMEKLMGISNNCRNSKVFQYHLRNRCSLVSKDNHNHNNSNSLHLAILIMIFNKKHWNMLCLLKKVLKIIC